MFGKPFQTFNIIHICMGTIIILSITKVCSDNIRYKTGIWSIDPQAFYMYNQPSKFRKLYWYNTRAPHFTSRKQRMVNLQLKHGYRNAPPEIAASYGNAMRNTFKNTYDDGSLSTNILRTYMTSVRIPSTSLPKTTANQPYFEQPKQPVHKNVTICKQTKNLTIVPEVVKESINILPHFRGLEGVAHGLNAMPSVRGYESISNSISNTIPPMIEPPFQPYITHSYFTLDDVIVPNAPKTLHSPYKLGKEQMLPSDSQPQNSFITQKTTHFKERAVQIFSTSTSTSTTTMEPVKTTDYLEQTTMEIRPTEAATTRQTLTHYTTVSPTVTTDMPNTFVNSKKSIIREIFNGFGLTRTPTTNIPNTIYDKKNWSPKKHISFRKNLMPVTLNDDFCYSCGINNPSNENITLNEVKPTTLNVTKIQKEKQNNTLISKQKEGRKKLSIKLLATKIKAAQNKTKNQTIPNISSTTELIPIRNRRNKTSFVHMRRRKLEANATRFKAYNVSRNNSMNSKILKLKTELKTPILNITNEKVNVREARVKIPVSNNTILATTSSPVTETTALAAESAIMTISNTNGRSLRRSMRKFRKHTPVAADIALKPIDLLHGSTEVPKLPIEVYFTKLNKT